MRAWLYTVLILGLAVLLAQTQHALQPVTALTMLAHWVSAALLAWAPFSLGQNTTSNSSADLDFGPVVFAGYNNYVYRDNTTSAQVVLTKSVIHALPS